MDTNEIEVEMSESAAVSGLEVYSTPNVSQDNKTNEFNVTNEVNGTNDSGIQLTPKLDSKNKKPNENISSETGAKSTPEVTNVKEKELSLDDIFHFMKANSTVRVR